MDSWGWAVVVEIVFEIVTDGIAWTSGAFLNLDLQD